MWEKFMQSSRRSIKVQEPFKCVQLFLMTKRELTPGAYVEIDLVLQEIKDAIMVPSEAIVPDVQGDKVFVYRNGKAVPQLVTQNIRTENEVQIINGLNVGDTIIVSGIIQLKPNAPG